MPDYGNEVSLKLTPLITSTIGYNRYGQWTGGYQRAVNVQKLMVGMFVSIVFFALSGHAFAKTTVTKFQLKGNTVTALFQVPDPVDHCLQNFVSVTASDLMEKVSLGGRTPTMRTVVVVIQRYSCNNNDTIVFSGEQDTENSRLEVARNLKSATLTAKVTLINMVSQLSYTFDINLAWKATGEAASAKSKERFRDRNLGISIKSSSSSTLVPAMARGSVFGIGHNLTPDPSHTATIEYHNDASLTIEKTP